MARGMVLGFLLVGLTIALPRGSSGQDADDSVTIIINGIPDKAAADGIVARLKTMMDPGPSHSFRSSQRNRLMTVTMRPVHDPFDLAKRIDFGKVKSVQENVINVEVAASRAPAAKSAAPSASATPKSKGAMRPSGRAGMGGARGARGGRGNWQAEKDPSPEPAEIAAGRGVTITAPSSFFGAEVLFPNPSSPFVALGRNGDQNDAREIWDLRTQKKVGRIQGKLDFDENVVALSPDGSTLAGKPTFRDAVEMWDTKAGRGLGTLQTGPGIDYIDFAGPERLLTANLGQRMFQVWDIKAGERLREFSVPQQVERESLAVSPGGRYLAMSSEKDARVRLYEIEEGRPIGEAPIPKDGFGPKCQGMAFSADGTELAGLFEVFGKGRFLMAWDATNGKTLAEHHFDASFGLTVPPFAKVRGIEWLADKSGWLVNGQAVVDRESGQKVWNVPADPEDLKKGPRRIVGDMLVFATGTDQNKVLKSVVIPSEQIAKASKLVRSGGSAVDAELPELKAADWKGVKKIKVARAAAKWTVAPEPAPSSRFLAPRPIGLKVTNAEVQKVLFSSPEVGQAAVSTGAPATPQFGAPPGQAPAADGRPRKVQCFDLTTGRQVGALEFPAALEMLAFSPDGSSVLTSDVKEHLRVDVWSATDGKHVAGWRPFEKERGDQAVIWADFLDASRVLTVNRGGMLVLWSLPDCKAVYSLDLACFGAPVLSPGRKSLAGFLNGTIRFLDPETGELKGEAAAPSNLVNQAELKAAAFSNDGQELLALFTGFTMARWNLKDGRIVSQFQAPLMGSQIEWCGPRHALFDGKTLVDLERGWLVWNYYGGPGGTGSPDGRHWFVTGAAPTNPASLTAVPLPEKKVDVVVAMAADKKSPAILRVGSKVSLQFDFGNGAPPGLDPATFRRGVTDRSAEPRDRLVALGDDPIVLAQLVEGMKLPIQIQTQPTSTESVQKLITDSLTEKLKLNGISVADNQPVRIIVRFAERDTGKTMSFQRMGDIRSHFHPEVVKVTEVDCEVTLNDATGKIDLAPKKSFTNRAFMTSGDDITAVLKRMQWSNATAYVKGISLPYFMARQPDGTTVTLPGFSDLNQATR